MYKALGLQNTNAIYSMLYLQYLTKCGYIGCPEKKYQRPTSSKQKPPRNLHNPPITSEAQVNPDPEIKTTQTESKQSEKHQPERRGITICMYDNSWYIVVRHRRAGFLVNLYGENKLINIVWGTLTFLIYC